jgi:type VI secretion system protein ImpL
MDPIFLTVAAAAILAGALAARMIGRARAPQAAARACCEDDAPAVAEETPLPWGRRLLDGFDYLRTRREWRYRTPWVMVLGARLSGKSSLPAAVSPEHCRDPDWREAELGVASAEAQARSGAQWQFLRQGVLIDVDGMLPNAAPGSANAARWERLLEKLDALRPERALDGLVLTVSAAALIEGSDEALVASAQQTYRQLETILDRFEFALPVYVVVTHADAIPGFAEFWGAQPERRGEMFGWAFGGQAVNATPEQWADQVFDGLGRRLNALLVEVAAERDGIDGADGFFLFPRRLEAWREPLRRWLSVAFQSNAWRPGGVCRGVWFTGRLDGRIAFVDDLVTRKVLDEPRFAIPNRSGVLSRNRLIRTLQLAGTAALAAWLVLFGLQAWQLDRQLHTLADSIELVRNTRSDIESGETCFSKDLVWRLATQVSKIDVNLHAATMPVSWLVPGAGGMGASVIEDQALQRVIMPGLRCRLGVRAQELLRDDPLLAPDDDGSRSGADAYASLRHQMMARLAAIDTLEDNLARFQRIAAAGHHGAEDAILHDFVALAEYAYGDRLPPEVRHERGALAAALVAVRYKETPRLPPALRTHLAGDLQGLSQKLFKALLTETAVGGDLLAQLNGPDPDGVPERARHFMLWLSWVRGSWVGSSETRNPCADIFDELGPGLRALVEEHHYPGTLDAVRRPFDTPYCYTPLVKTLLSMRMGAGEPFFVERASGVDINARLEPNAQGIGALMALDFIQARPAAFRCDPLAAGWGAEPLAQAADAMRDYQKFALAHGLQDTADGGRRPLYDRLARRQLVGVLRARMNDAQTAPAAGSPLQRASLDPIALADQRMAEASADFGRAVEPLLGVLRVYQQAGFSHETAPIEECARAFAAASLGRVDQLAAGSRLYAPDTDGAGFFAPAPIAETRDYLARQVARGQVLASYAAPFVALLQNTAPTNDAGLPNAHTAAYWRNSIAELGRYTEAQEQNGQVGYLHALFLKTFAGLDAGNCGKTLGAYQPPEAGNDLFSGRRRQLEERVRWRCGDRAHAQTWELYDELRTRFERELAGQYPFAPLDAPNAQPAAVRAFFADYEGRRAALHQALDNARGARWDPLRRFIGQLDAAAEFFKGGLGGADGAHALRLAVNFRAVPDLGDGSDQIVTWALTSGAHVISYPNRTGPLDWYAGQPLVLDLTWASRSAWTPVEDSRQRDLQTSGATATFAEAGEWALLRMIERHRARGADDGGLDPNRILLEFAVPVVPSDGPPDAAARAPVNGMAPRTARARLAIGLSAADPKTQAPLAVRLPGTFPRSAPPFPAFQEPARNPVLTQN